MTRRQIRGTLAVPVLGLFAAVLFWGLSGLPPFGDFHGFYGQLLNHIALPQRHTTNVVAAIVFDYRSFDTLGEEFILFAAVSGVVMLLRGDDDEEDDPEAAVTSDALRMWGVLLAAVVILVGLWLVGFGMVTPGGGFQGGVTIAGGLLVLYLTVGYTSWRRLSKDAVVDPIEGAGAGAYVVVGLAALIAGAPFLHNVLGPGQPGTLFSGGSMTILNWSVAVEVAAANVTLYTQFLARYIAPLLRDRAS